MDKKNKVALVTGASRGIGQSIAAMLVGEGFRVYGTSRNPNTIDERDKLPGVEYLPMDLSDSKSISKLIKKLDEVDVLINNAGASQVGAVEEVSLEAVQDLFEKNLFSQLHLIQGFLPGMRERREGLIINVSSMAAKTPVPFSSFYASSKAALEVLSRGLRQEVKKYGIKVVIVAPFHIKTDIPQEVQIEEDSPYYDDAMRVKSIRDDNLKNHSPEPEVVANLVKKIIYMKNPKPGYAAGDNAGFMSHIIRFLPRRMVEKNVRKRFNLD